MDRALRLGWARGRALRLLLVLKKISKLFKKIVTRENYIWEVAAFPSWGSCHLGNCHLRKCTFWKLPLAKLHIWEVATWENTLGKLPLGKGLWEIA